MLVGRKGLRVCWIALRQQVSLLHDLWLVVVEALPLVRMLVESLGLELGSSVRLDDGGACV